jgi:outer membrane immunogenic protein
MRRLTIAAVAAISTISLPQTTSAADLPYKAPAYVPPLPLAYSWTGFYVGGEVGAKWGRDEWTATSLADTAIGGVRSPIDSSSPRNYDSTAARFGVFAGYNWQFAPRWVAGIEGDWAYANKTTTEVGFPGCTNAVCTVGFVSVPNGQPAGGDLTSFKMRWDASVRGRLGFLATPDLLLYGTGGVAWQNVEVSGACGPWPSSFQCNGPPQPVPSFVSQTNTLTGWTVGAGAEWHAWGNWLLRGEYRYANFGTSSYVFPFGTTVTNNTYRFDVHNQTHIATFGLAYKF